MAGHINYNKIILETGIYSKQDCHMEEGTAFLLVSVSPVRLIKTKFYIFPCKFPLFHSCDIIFSITWRLALTTKYPLVLERLKVSYSSFSGPIYRSGTRLDSDSGGACLRRILEPLVHFSAHLRVPSYHIIIVGATIEKDKMDF